MKKNILQLITLLMIGGIAYAQVGIGTTTPQATLDVVGAPANAALPDGILIPRLTRAQLTTKNAAYAASQTGTMIYVTDVTGGDNAGSRVYVTAPGFYLFDGTVWTRAGGGPSATTLTYSAEYAGASLQADGSSNELVLNASNTGAPSFINYYQATNFRTDGGTNDYDVVLSIKLPSDFNTFQANALTIAFTGTANASFEADVFEQGNAVAIRDNAAVAGAGLGAFATNTIATAAQLAALTTGDTMIIRIKLTVTDAAVANSSIIRIGDVSLNYNKL